MNPEQHYRALHIFDDAVALNEDERQTYLENACGSDIALRSFVERMLTFEKQSSVDLDSGELGFAIHVQHDRPATSQTIPAFEQLGRYRILGVLGRGSSGIVYRAEQGHPRREVALKVLHADPRTSEFRWRFENEIRVLARLRDPGIAQIYDAGVLESPSGSQPYIAMELVDGESLTTFAKKRHLNMRERLELLRETCRAVNYAHRRSVIHRDLKPANILVEDTPDGPRPRILDFGVARVTDRAGHTASQATIKGQLLGTVAYMSPEQVGGDPDEIDIRADVYALGVVGYELLCGKRPIDTDGLSVFGALQAVRDREPRPLSDHGVGFRGDLSRIFAKALAKDKELRYDTPAALADDIKSVLTHCPVQARDPSVLYVLRKFVRRNRVVAGVALAGLLAAGFGLFRTQQANMQLREQYERTRAVSTFLAGDFADNLHAVAGASKARRVMLERLRDHIETLLIDNPDDLELLAAHANTITYLSDLDLEERDFESALELRKSALAERRRLIDTSPNDPERLADLSIITVKLGDLYYGHMGDRAAGEQWYRDALEIDEQLARDYPDSRRFADNLGRSYARLGTAARKANRLPEAARYLTKCLSTFERLEAEEPDNPVILHGLWEAHAMLAGLASLESRATVAREHTRQSLTFIQRARVLDPTNRVYLMACVLSLSRVASIHVNAGDLDAAIPLAGEALATAEELCELDPLDTEYQLALCTVLLTQCRIDTQRESFESAVKTAQRATEIAGDLHNRDPENVYCAETLAAAQWHLSVAAAGLGDMSAARSHLTRNLALLRSLVDRDDARVVHIVRYAKRLLSPPVPEMRDPAAAQAAAQRAVELTGRQDAGAWYLLARCQRAQGQWKPAIESLEQAIEFLPEHEEAQREDIQSVLAAVRVQSRGE